MYTDQCVPYDVDALGYSHLRTILNGRQGESSPTAMNNTDGCLVTRGILEIDPRAASYPRCGKTSAED